ncbi:MAG: hypothetical protein EBU23_18075, partial [Mycobacteriaceae bacterium]|nr:hypothetical protein [Mycobacteriaceae bacterium]
MRIVSLVGNRPQFVKAAPLCQALRAQGEEILVHSGQHYDPDLADLFFDELGIPAPDHALAVGPGSPLHQLTIMMGRLEPVLADEKPDALLVYGDTTTTLAGALVAAKMNVPLAHVEAGLRSFDKRMPEEQNRVIRRGHHRGRAPGGGCDVRRQPPVRIAGGGTARPGGPGAHAGRLSAGDHPPRGGHRHARGPRRHGGRAHLARPPRHLPGAPAHEGQVGGRRPLGRAAGRAGAHHGPARRIPRLHRPADEGRCG